MKTDAITAMRADKFDLMTRRRNHWLRWHLHSIMLTDEETDGIVNVSMTRRREKTNQRRCRWEDETRVEKFTNV